MNAPENKEQLKPEVTGQVLSSDIPPQPAAPTASPETPPTKRGRGRPVGSGKKQDTTEAMQEKITEAAGAGESTKGPSKARAKRSGGNGGNYNVEKLAKQIEGVHTIAAKFTGLGFLQVSTEESYAVAESIVGVCREYDFEISGKTGAALQLFATAAMIYGPRAIMFAALKKQAEQRAHAVRTTGPVHDVSNNNAG